jgi:glycosyltransferase involved in cell wall biosynthesis
MQTVLAVHNFYQHAGGEDEVYRGETELLAGHGHSVIRYEEDNARVHGGWATGFGATWNLVSYRRLRAAARTYRPDVAHIYNTFPLISPSAYYALKKQGVPIVQKLGNFRLLCPGANLVRDGKVCEQCIEHRSFLPAISHRCYRSSLPATAAVSAMLTVHRVMGTWQKLVDVFVAHTEFARRKFIEGGLPADRIAVTPHMISPDPGVGEGRGGYALFVGRLSEEKGVRTLVKAWQKLPEIPLLVAGDGPLGHMPWPRGVTWLGELPHPRVLELMKNAHLLVVPSVCYEIGPLTILEAFACGVPVIASDLGSMAERVEHGVNGLLFRPGDADDLVRQVHWAFGHPEQWTTMRAEARREFERKYTAERSYRHLMDIYEMAKGNARGVQREAAVAVASAS